METSLGPDNNQPIANRRYGRQIILMLAGISAMVLFFLSPANKTWLKDRIIPYWKDFRVQRKKLSHDQRMTMRFESSYTYSKQVAGFFQNRPDKKDVMVLLPSEAYFKRHGITYVVPQPVTFYYFTGLKTVWANDSTAIHANWYIKVAEKKLLPDSVTDTNRLKDSINAFKK